MWMTIASVSYLSSALAFALLAVFLLTSWRARLHGGALTLASLATVLWAAVVAYQAAHGVPLPLLVDLLEIMRNAAWTVLLLMLLGHFEKNDDAAFKLTPLLATIAALYVLLILATLYTYWKPQSVSAAIGFMTSIAGRVALAVLGMLLVEQLYRNSQSKERWGIKFACLGIGGLFAYDFYLYSDALLFRQVNAEIWTARGLVNALAVPLMALSVARNPQWSLGIAVSRSMLFHSAVLVGSAVYLLAMAGAGYYLRYFGGSWGALMQVAFLCGAGILLVGALFSGALRAKLKVFISKHFYRYNYDYRDEWLRFTRTLSESGPHLGERAVQAVADLVESPGGALFVSRESGRCEAVAHWNLDLMHESEPLQGAFCQFLQDKQWVVDLQECRDDPEKYGELQLPVWLEQVPRAWLVVPLMLQGRLFGFVVLAQSRSDINLNWEVIDLLKIAGSQAASYLGQQESAHALMVARQFESFNRMSTFMVHDLKNLVAQLSLLLSNAEKHKNNPEFQKDMFETVDYSVQKMKLLLQKLSRGVAVENATVLALDELLQQAVALKASAEPRPTLEIADAGLLVWANSARLERVIGHLIQNAVEATGRDGKVIVRVRRQDASALIEVADTGVGMSADFVRDRLFAPFESTKVAGMGIGVFESREYIRELGGQIDVVSDEAVGTTFRLLLPLQAADSGAGDAVEQAA